MENLEQALTDVPTQPEQVSEPQPVDENGNLILPPPNSGLTPPANDQVPVEAKDAEGPAAPTPRPMVEIQKQYDELVKAAGEEHYQAEMHKMNLAHITRLLRGINNEAAARNELDKKAAQEAVNKAQEKRNQKAAKRAEALKAGMTEAEADTLAATVDATEAPVVTEPATNA